MLVFIARNLIKLFILISYLFPEFFVIRRKKMQGENVIAKNHLINVFFINFNTLAKSNSPQAEETC